VHRILGEGDPSLLAEVLRSAVPTPIAAALDWTSLSRVEGTFVDDALRRHHTDILCRARLRDCTAYVYTLVDAKAAPERNTAFQLLRYVTRIWERLQAELGSGVPLPPVVPFVLYSGRRPWNTARCVLDLVDLQGLPPELAAALRPLQPDMHFLLDDLSRQDDAALRARVLGAVSRLCLMALRQRRRQSIREATVEVARWVDVLAAAWTTPSGPALLQVIMHYLLQTRHLDMPRLQIEIRSVLGTEVGDQLMKTTADILRQQGRAQGRAEGRAEGQAELLLHQLERRFGSLPAAIVARIRSGSPQDLQRWAGAVLEATTLDAVLAAE
jgi:predicted transposase YdaD